MVCLKPGLHSELLVLSDEEDDVLGPVVLHPEERGGTEKQGHRNILNKCIMLNTIIIIFKCKT